MNCCSSNNRRAKFLSSDNLEYLAPSLDCNTLKVHSFWMDEARVLGASFYIGNVFWWISIIFERFELFTIRSELNFGEEYRMNGHCVVPIADCRKKYYNSQMKDSMMLSKYLDYWIRYRNSSYSINMPLLYLKDWHCVKNHPNIFIYEVPQYFASDWLNEYYTSHTELDDDYMFVYMGPRGTWTPFHVDVFTSYSWSANIVGKKRWLLFPPGEENHLCDFQGQLIYDATSEELNDHSKYREYDHNSLRCYELIQDPGEIVFIPSGWHHQVWNLEDTISVNHNWINGCNILNMWLALKKELLAVMKEVNDYRDMNDWTGHCQLMLKTLHGMDYTQFYDFLSFIATKRLEQIIKKESIISFKKWYLGINHCLFDLRQIKAVLEDFIKDTKEKSILIYLNDQAQELLCKINTLL